MQIWPVTVRLRVPLSSQRSVKPAQVLHGPGLAEPHATPSVTRAQPAVSISSSVSAAQVPPTQVWVVRRRVREPEVEHVGWPYAHAP